MKRENTLRLALASLTVAALSTLAACGGGAGDEEGGEAGSITIGSKNFTEPVLFGELYAQALEAEDYDVERNLDLGNVAVLDQALQSGEIDTYVEYTGTGLVTALDYEGDQPETREETYELAEERYEDRDPAATLLEEAPFENTYAIAVFSDAAEEYGLETLGDLEEASPELTLASFSEFQQREDGFPNMETRYPGLDFEDIRTVNDLGLRYQAVQQGEAEVAIGFTTDSQLLSDDLVTLEDEQNIWPFYYPAPVIDQEYLDENPEVAEVMDSVTETLDLDTMREMIGRVDLDQEDASVVAEAHLTEEGLI